MTGLIRSSAAAELCDTLVVGPDTGWVVYVKDSHNFRRHPRLLGRDTPLQDETRQFNNRSLTVVVRALAGRRGTKVGGEEHLGRFEHGPGDRILLVGKQVEHVVR